MSSTQRSRVGLGRRERRSETTWIPTSGSRKSWTTAPIRRRIDSIEEAASMNSTSTPRDLGSAPGTGTNHPMSCSAGAPSPPFENPVPSTTPGVPAKARSSFVRQCRSSSGCAFITGLARAFTRSPASVR